MLRRTPHILIADDEPEVRNLFTRLLCRGGYAVTHVGGGGAALTILDEKQVDLLVLDLSMPQPDGFELLKLLRWKRPELRILVVSSYMEGALLKAAEILGATAAMSKADAPKLLLPTVNGLLQ